MTPNDADTAQMHLAKAIKLSTAVDSSLSTAREQIATGHRADELVVEAIEAEGRRRRELLREAMQLLEAHTSDNLEVRI